MATDVPRIAVGQMCASSDVEKNLEVVADLCARAKDRGCAMLFLPECFAFIGVKGTDALAVMEPLDGPLLGRYRELAARHRLWLSLGGFAEKGPDRNRRFNAHVIVNDAGEIQASYRKIHLFDVDMGDVNGPVLMESATAAAGETLVTCDSPAGKLGLTVCYDLRFPEMFARLRYELGCEVMLVPSAFTKPTGQAHWETLLRARAIETQSYVVAAAQAGVHSEGRASHGHAMIVDPWGKVVAELDGEETGIAVADVDLGYLKDVRSRIPVETHRRDIASFPVERR
jgi:deaminated glutathione amidase